MPGVALLLEERDPAEEEEDGGGEGRGRGPEPLDVPGDGGGHQEEPEPETDLSEVVRVAGHAPQAHCTPLAPVTGIIPENIDKSESKFTNVASSPEVEFLLVTDSLTDEAHGKQYKADNIHGSDVIKTKKTKYYLHD